MFAPNENKPFGISISPDAIPANTDSSVEMSLYSSSGIVRVFCLSDTLLFVTPKELKSFKATIGPP